MPITVGLSAFVSFLKHWISVIPNCFMSTSQRPLRVETGYLQVKNGQRFTGHAGGPH